MNLVSFASACDRTGVFDRAATIIANSVFYDNAGCFKTNPSLVLDRSKVRRSCQKHRSFLQKEAKKQMITKMLLLCTLMLGRIRQCLKISVNSKEIIQEEHISIVKEPGSKYFCHLALKKVSANAIANGIFDFLSANYKKNNIIAIGFDGTAVNTGTK